MASFPSSSFSPSPYSFSSFFFFSLEYQFDNGDPRKTFSLIEKVGSGSYGDVYKVRSIRLSLFRTTWSSQFSFSFLELFSRSVAAGLLT